MVGRFGGARLLLGGLDGALKALVEFVGLELLVAETVGGLDETLLGAGGGEAYPVRQPADEEREAGDAEGGGDGDLTEGASRCSRSCAHMSTPATPTNSPREL
jgi:hypothetical protein